MGMLEIGRRKYLVNMHMYAQFGAFRSSRLFLVHATFRARRLHARWFFNHF